MSPSSNHATRVAAMLLTVASLCAPVSLTAQETKPLASFSNSAQALRDSIVRMARAQLGKRYRLGGESPEKGFDCSGLVAYVMSGFNVTVARTAKQQAKEGLAVRKDTSRLLPGDILTFGRTKKSVSHVGIYVGDGKYIHASSVAGRVIESPVDRPVSRLVQTWRGARRLLADDSATVVAPDSPPRSQKGGN